MPVFDRPGCSLRSCELSPPAMIWLPAHADRPAWTHGGRSSSPSIAGEMSTMRRGGWRHARAHNQGLGCSPAVVLPSLWIRLARDQPRAAAPRTASCLVRPSAHDATRERAISRTPRLVRRTPVRIASVGTRASSVTMLFACRQPAILTGSRFSGRRDSCGVSWSGATILHVLPFR
jgi:hypothetical protein